jgi:prepilin-type N-terminal cleavage/methylation domain-containing protein
MIGTKRMRRSSNGTTLIELLVALVISTVLVAGLYRTFVSQQKTFAVQEQVVDVQQNARAAINRLMRDIRMAGFGNVSMVLPATFSSGTYNSVLNPDTPAAGAVTVLSAIGEAATFVVTGGIGETQITVSRINDDQNNPLFDTDDRKYISIAGLESHVISSIDTQTKTITLGRKLVFNHGVGVPIFAIRALTYQLGTVDGVPTLLRDEHTGEGPQPQGDGIEDLQFQYMDAGGNVTANPADVRMMNIALTARSETVDAELKEGGGHRRRRITSTVHLRNMGIEP